MRARQVQSRYRGERGVGREPALDRADPGAGDPGAPPTILDFKLPIGPYQANCSACTVDDTKLACHCADAGNTADTTINYRACNTPIIQYGGVLSCDGVPESAASYLPTGSYLKTCSQCWGNSRTINCFCLNSSGDSLLTGLDGADRCVNDVENQNGVLGCAQNAYVGSPQPKVQTQSSNVSTTPFMASSCASADLFSQGAIPPQVDPSNWPLLRKDQF